MPTNPRPKPRYLTKSRFKSAHQCPTKLTYVGKSEYANATDDNGFLRALAEGGFQVGALAKLFFPGGIEVQATEYEAALAQTNALLARDEVTIFEAAFRVDNLFIRADIVKKKGDRISFFEVKAKSYYPGEDEFYDQRSKAKKLTGKWEPYLIDVAFQHYVLRNALPTSRIIPHLLLVNKTGVASIEGLNQNFVLRRTLEGRTEVELKRRLQTTELGRNLLIALMVDDEVRHINSIKHEGKSFADWVKHLSDSYASDVRIEPSVGSKCKKCEFRSEPVENELSLKSGFEECWQPLVGDAADEPLVLDLWDNRSPDKHIKNGKFRLVDLTREDVEPEPREEGSGLSRKQRQWIQVEKTLQRSSQPFLDPDGLAAEINKWRYPLHFIDFETAQPAIPLNKGRRPYEQLAFQFSHHIVYEDGRTEHAGEFINLVRGKFPNFEFIRALKRELEKDEGTIFRYAAHENTVLCQIHEQLGASEDIPRQQAEDLRSWIRSITKKKHENKKDILWEGPRNMIDMREIVLRYYYHPQTWGSNSLKHVLPATLQGSKYLQDRYSKPIYGTAHDLISRNFQNMQWVRHDQKGNVVDPYKTLEPIFSPEEDQRIERLYERLYPEREIADGGAAMMAYCRMQFTEMDEAEVKRITQALLRYCELDTFAMVLLFEYWREEATNARKRGVA